NCQKRQARSFIARTTHCYLANRCATDQIITGPARGEAARRFRAPARRNCGPRGILRAMELVTRQLTEKQARFVEAYLNGRNITGAATDAGYSGSTASQIGSALLRQPHIQNAIQAGVRHALAMDAPLAR